MLNGFELYPRWVPLFRTSNITFEARLMWFMAYRTRNITFVACLLWFMAYRTRNITVGACLFRFMAYIYSSYNEELIRSVSIKHTDRYDSYGPYEPTTHCALMS